jgi:hypothetical protein
MNTNKRTAGIFNPETRSPGDGVAIELRNSGSPG